MNGYYRCFDVGSNDFSCFLICVIFIFIFAPSIVIHHSADVDELKSRSIFIGEEYHGFNTPNSGTWSQFVFLTSRGRLNKFHRSSSGFFLFSGSETAESKHSTSLTKKKNRFSMWLPKQLFKVNGRDDIISHCNLLMLEISSKILAFLLK